LILFSSQFEIYPIFKSKSNSIGIHIRIPIWFGVGGPIVLEPVSVWPGTPRGWVGPEFSSYVVIA